MPATIQSGALYTDRTFTALQMAGTELVSTEFDDCVFVQCSFVESVFKSCRFTNCTFEASDLSLVQVPESTFSGTRFEHTRLIGVNWAQATWPRTGLGNPLAFFKSNLSHSTFIGLSLKKIQIRDCVAVEVDLRETDLSGADFGGTDLSNSIFGDTDLTEADLSQARNYAIDPARNVLRRAKFSLPEAISLLYSLDIELVLGS